MARLNVSPTRMVLSNLKQRKKTAVRGHKLLKDKQDELMRQFIELVKKNMKMREKLEIRLQQAFQKFMLASAVMGPEFLETAVSFSEGTLQVKIETINKMSVRVPKMTFISSSPLADSSNKSVDNEWNVKEHQKENLKENISDQVRQNTNQNNENQAILPYGFMQTSADLDLAIQTIKMVMTELLQLAEIEKTCQLMADDIESTRRRVNALEYRTIPDLEETISFIRMKLEENERATNTRLMKVKEMIADQS